MRTVFPNGRAVSICLLTLGSLLTFIYFVYSILHNYTTGMVRDVGLRHQLPLSIKESLQKESSQKRVLVQPSVSTTLEEVENGKIIWVNVIITSYYFLAARR